LYGVSDQLAVRKTEFVTTDEQVRRLEEKLYELEKRVISLEKENSELREANERLGRELHKFKNSNTPPSANQHLKPDTRPVKTNHKRGAPLGHLGVTRQWQEADEKRHVTANKCPNGHSNVQVIGSEHRQIEELPEIVEPIIVDVETDKLKCNECGIEFLARDGKTPTQGRFGVRLMVLVLMLKFILRGVLRKTAGFLEAGFALRITPATVNAIITRAAQAAEGEYSLLKQKIRLARIVYADETSFSVLGMKWWVWVFRTDADVLLVIRYSRAGDVPEEVLGKTFSGILVCDGWRAYDCLSDAKIQRCWAHLLRKSAELKSVPGLRFNKKLRALFKSIAKFNFKPRTSEERLQKYAQLTFKLKKAKTYYSRYQECLGVSKYVGFRLDEWFTCVKLEGVEPTNNFAEQAIRETVVVRKIIGAFRSESGTKVYETLASLLATWQIQQRNINKELYRMLSAGLC
jgi:transposase